MCKKLICLISLALVLFLAGKAPGATNIEWTDEDPNDHLWTSPNNWSRGVVPDGDYAAFIRGPASVEATSPIIQDGMTFTVVYVIVNEGNSTYTAYLRMTGGTINTTNFRISWDNQPVGGVEGVFNMSGGTVNASSLQIGPGGGTGTFNLYGGTFSAGAMTISSTSNMDISAGTLIINGDEVSTVQGYIDDPNGLITAYGGYGTLQLDYDVTNEGKTTLKATHLLNPNPADGSSVPDSVNQLQWTLPEPNQPGGVVTCDVYFGTDPDIENNPKVVTRQAVESVSVTLAPDTTYYWALDLYDSSISATEPFMLGHIFKFDTQNQPPIVNAGADVATWLDNGLRVVHLDGVVSDEDGGPEPATLLWMLIAEPNELNPAQISDPLAANPTVTIKEPGSYTLQIEAGDGEFSATDTMQIVLYADPCEHAQNQEGFELIPGDINEDCIVNELDLAILEEHWLEENFSVE
ncbi:MAG TPA: hypothetical protein VMW72_20555 [Sedimentisphaerales bacterium]|nr:hypothetical protein [Sedimentisphaerales bacterium]